MKQAMVEDEHYYKKQAMRLSAKVKELEKVAQTAIEKFHGKRIDYDYAKEENTKLKAERNLLNSAYKNQKREFIKLEAALKIADEALRYYRDDDSWAKEYPAREALEKIKETLGEG